MKAALMFLAVAPFVVAMFCLYLERVPLMASDDSNPADNRAARDNYNREGI